MQSGMGAMQVDKNCSKTSTCLVTSRCDISKVSNSSDGACVNGGYVDIAKRVMVTKTSKQLTSYQHMQKQLTDISNASRVMERVSMKVALNDERVYERELKHET